MAETSSQASTARCDGQPQHQPQQQYDNEHEHDHDQGRGGSGEDDARSGEPNDRERREMCIEPDSRPRSSEDCLGDTVSLTSEVSRYPYENGRRYHKYREGSYFFPNDDIENERLDMQHELLTFVYGGRLHFAPLDKPEMILDIGTGTGSWAIDMADRYPAAQVIGTDLSPIQPPWVPHNVRFIIDDATERDWLLTPSTFDLIHTRILMGSFTSYPSLLRTALPYLKPGAWLESQEFLSSVHCDDGTMPANWPFLEWNRLCEEASERMGKPMRIANRLKRWYREAGLVDVREEVFRVPVNPWPREGRYKSVGRMSEVNWLDGLQGFSLGLFCRVFGWSRNELEAYLVNVRNAISDRSVHAYHKNYVVWGRKPYPHEVEAMEREKEEARLRAAAEEDANKATGAAESTAGPSTSTSSAGLPYRTNDGEASSYTTAPNPNTNTMPPPPRPHPHPQTNQPIYGSARDESLPLRMAAGVMHPNPNMEGASAAGPSEEGRKLSYLHQASSSVL